MTSGNTTEKHETRAFKAEVKQVLDIVIHSLYTHREIFIRELISNASDALEKMRHESLTQKEYLDKDSPLEIRIQTDTANHTLTITDTGVGMTHDELIDNLGTIASSGTRQFLNRIGENATLDTELIGKFGVGFYSSFMAASEVDVRSQSFNPTENGYEWKSDGISRYTIEKMPNLPRGTTVIVRLKEDAFEFEHTDRVKEVITKYSNFVPFPIFVNGERVNTIQAIWTKTPSDVSDREYKEFYNFLSLNDEEPMYRLHLVSDAPIQLSSILYVPNNNLEHLWFVRLKPSINIYCKKILIQHHTDNLIPDYLRFVTGVVDSADLPLNISRETLQDNLIFRKLGKFLTKRIVRFFEDESKKEPKKYQEFWGKFGIFIKEGILADVENQKELAHLLRFQSSSGGKDDFVSLDEYMSRCHEEQKTIYYLSGRTRDDIEKGPYLETFLKRGVEVLYCLEPIDDFIMTTLAEYEGKKLMSGDSASVDLPPVKHEEKETPIISDSDNRKFTQWMKDVLGDRVSDVRKTERIFNRPAIIVNSDTTITTTMHRVMKATGKDLGFSGKIVLEINPEHPIITALKKLRDGTTDKGFLNSCVEQIYDNALAESGLLDDPRPMVERIYALMERALQSEDKGAETH